MSMPPRILLAAGTAALLLTLLTGCYQYIDSRTTVLDAETGKPISGASVSVSYPGWPLGPVISPRGDQGLTDDDGEVILGVTRDSKKGTQPWWRAEAPGYLHSFTWLDHDDVWDQIELALSAKGDVPMPEITLELWAEPAPTVIIIIPDDYRGFVRICDSTESPQPILAHQRVFECEIDHAGLCELPAARILQRNQSPWPLNARLEFRFQNGTLISRRSGLPEEGDELGAWALSSVDNCPVFIIGTETDAAREQRALRPQGVIDSDRYREFARRVRQGRFEQPEIEQPR